VLASVAAFLSLLTLGAATSDASPAAPPAATSHVGGRVFWAFKPALPLTSARVALVNIQSGRVVSAAATDKEGRFEIPRAPNGSYELQVRAQISRQDVDRLISQDGPAAMRDSRKIMAFSNVTVHSPKQSLDVAVHVMPPSGQGGKPARRATYALVVTEVERQAGGGP
jgi:hypothetical protein